MVGNWKSDIPGSASEVAENQMISDTIMWIPARPFWLPGNRHSATGQLCSSTQVARPVEILPDADF